MLLLPPQTAIALANDLVVNAGLAMVPIEQLKEIILQRETGLVVPIESRRARYREKNPEREIAPVEPARRDPDL